MGTNSTLASGFAVALLPPPYATCNTRSFGSNTMLWIVDGPWFTASSALAISATPSLPSAFCNSSSFWYREHFVLTLSSSERKWLVQQQTSLVPVRRTTLRGV